MSKKIQLRNISNLFRKHFLFRNRKVPKKDENTHPKASEPDLMPSTGTDFRTDENGVARARPGMEIKLFIFLVCFL